MDNGVCVCVRVFVVVSINDWEHYVTCVMFSVKRLGQSRSHGYMV